MPADNKIQSFLSNYDEQVVTNALLLRGVVLEQLPGIHEEVDLPAKMIAYSYGRKYSELICVIIPSKKGLKLGFNRGTELSDPGGILEGTAKISRYVVISSEKQIRSAAIRRLINAGLNLYKKTLKKTS